MDYKVLYRKYRPEDFSNIIGQDYMISILKNAITSSKISHAYIFSGPRGTGKTSTAKVFAKAINCQNPTPNGPCNACISCQTFKENADIIEIDAASNNGVDEIREIINNIKLAPAYSKYKVYIIDEVHMLSTSAFNALLLTLEEPPKHVVFILATTNIEAVPITILSRCQRFDFHKISLEDIIKRLNYVVSQENIDITPEALEEIAYISDGGLRDALSILDQLSSNNSKIGIDEVIAHFGSVSKKQINDLYTTIINNDIPQFNTMISKFKTLAIDYKLLIKKLLEKIEEEAIKSKNDSQYEGLTYQNLKDMAFSLADISNYVNINIDPFLLIEITLLNYFPGNNSQIPNNPTPKIPTNLPPNDNNYEPNAISSPELKSPSVSINYTDFSKLKSIRVNNCFVNAKKEYLQSIKEKWPQFLDNLEDKALLNILIDTNISAASDEIIILTHQLESPTNLINENIDNIASKFNQLLALNYKFIALTTNEWQTIRSSYITNLKNNVTYSYIAEDTPQTNNVEAPVPQTEPKVENSNIEQAAFDIFDKEKIKIE